MNAVAGTDTAVGSELLRVMVAPAAGGGPLRVSLPVTAVVALPLKVSGETVKPVNWAASTFRVAVLVTVPSFAVIIAVTFVAIGGVLTVKIAVSAPAGTVMLDGVVASGELDDKVTTLPPVGAVVERVTVPVANVPPMTVEGARETLSRISGVARTDSFQTFPSPMAPPEYPFGPPDEVVPYMFPTLSKATPPSGETQSVPLVPLARVTDPPKSWRSL